MTDALGSLGTAGLGVIGTVISGLLIYAGVRFTGHQSRAATDASTAVDGFDRLTNRLGTRLSEVERRLESVETQLTDSNRLLRVALAYIERLLDFVAEIAPDRKRIPPAIPNELTEHLPSSVVEDWRTPPPRE